MSPDEQPTPDARLSDYLAKVRRGGASKPIEIVAVFPFSGEVDPVIRWKQRFPGYDPRKFPMSSFGGTWLRIEYEDETLLARPGDYVVRTKEGEYYPVAPENLAFELRQPHANQPDQAR